MVRYTEQQILDLILKDYDQHKISLLAPVIRGRKGHYRELFEQIRKSGFLKVRVDGEIRDITFGMKLDRYKMHDIEIVIDRIEVNDKQKQRVLESREPNQVEFQCLLAWSIHLREVRQREALQRLFRLG